MTTQKIPATVITCFLWSGKTTLIRHMLENAKGRRSALIRQVMLEQNEHVVLQPLNKDYPLEFLTHDDIDVMFRVVGRLEIFADSTVDSTV